MDSDSEKNLESLLSENRALRIYIQELEENLEAAKQNTNTESATRMFRLIKEKKDQLDVNLEELEEANRKLAEYEKKLAEVEERASKHHGLSSMFRQIISALPGSVICADTKGRIIFSSVKAETFFVNQSPLHGKNLADLKNVAIQFDIATEFENLMNNPLRHFETTVTDGPFVYRTMMYVLRGKGTLVGGLVFIEKITLRTDAAE